MMLLELGEELMNLLEFTYFLQKDGVVMVSKELSSIVHILLFLLLTQDIID